MIRNPVGINSGVNRQLVDQPVHIICLVIDSPDILIHLFRCICNSIHDTFHISFNSSNRRFQIMGNIAYQLLILLFRKNLFVRRFLQPQPHILIVTVKLSDLSIFFIRKHIFQISFCNILHSNIQLIDGVKNTFTDPLGKK